MAAVFSYGGLRNLFRLSAHRYWELAGCTTRGPSQDQFDHGSGWWKNIAYYPNAPRDADEQRRRKSLFREHGVGIRYWRRRYGGKVHGISERRLGEERLSATKVTNYCRAATKLEEMN